MTDTEWDAGAIDAPGAVHGDASPGARRAARHSFVDRRAGALLCVFTGGALGTAAREALTLAYPQVGNIPYDIWAINVAGSLGLGFLLGVLVGGSSGLHRGLRLAAGTGFCGGFTTYSTLATQGADLARDGLGGAGLLYALGTLILGAAAAWAGILAGNAAARRREPAGDAGAAR